jgi:rSAM/selenodomain-associated transferase 1
VAGEVKTRLAPLLGAQGAAQLHERLVERALATAIESRVGPVELWCAPDESHPFFSRCAARFGARLRRQEGDDLGARMRHAFEQGLGESRAMLLIGSDCPALSAADLGVAARALEGHEAVFVPAEDGGYVLVGLTQPRSDIFESMPWGKPSIMEETRARLERGGVRWTALPALWDVDRPEDYARLQAAGLAPTAAR